MNIVVISDRCIVIDDIQPSGSSNTKVLETDLEELISILPEFTPVFIEAIYKASNQDFAATFDCLYNHQGTLESVLTIVKDAKKQQGLRDLPIHLGHPDKWLYTLLKFYKGHCFATYKEISFILDDSRGIDAGGVRRHVFSKVYEDLACGQLKIFEGNNNHLYPTHSISTITSGLLRSVGSMIAHTMIMENMGFPYLSKAMYYYMVGNVDLAITQIQDGDMSAKVHFIVNKVQ